MPTRYDERHIYSFDLTRAIAALAVVLLHWGNLSQPGGVPPFPNMLGFFYQYGALAVPLFFCLSGFVFTWLYGEEIFGAAIGFRRFFAIRIARLYPLYFATLAITGILTYFVDIRVYNFPLLHNDFYHFLISAMMLSGWGFERGFSFNGPSWSVSTEMFLYVLFYLVARRFAMSIPVCLMLIAAGLALLPVSVHLAGGTAQFFAGGIAYLAFRRWSVRRRRYGISIAAGSVVLLVCLYAAEFRTGTVLHVLQSLFPQFAKLEIRYQIVRDLIFPTLIFPLLIFVQAATERCANPDGQGSGHPLVRWFGNTSYALYLWHFPLAILCMAIVHATGASPTVFSAPATLISYLVVLVILSHFSFYWFERPAMLALRSRSGVRRSAPHATDGAAAE